MSSPTPDQRILELARRLGIAARALEQLQTLCETTLGALRDASAFTPEALRLPPACPRLGPRAVRCRRPEGHEGYHQAYDGLIKREVSW